MLRRLSFLDGWTLDGWAGFFWFGLLWQAWRMDTTPVKKAPAAVQTQVSDQTVAKARVDPSRMASRSLDYDEEVRGARFLLCQHHP